ncbi:benzoate/H(+) symporter BenE family transporter [Haloactinomyces albus]|uniref:Benzoate membrane transport protein n=1 Tax=Haloactinomyces albus TaxID=1352928 RepID=A0AAE3ZF19_9ACTN|nr:benzoate/H(+) symporter BenE family transporter [Haloactinomyces albus]MDR7303756.1 benzoate membrane transport protein [Haloactinomyces albus]
MSTSTSENELGGLPETDRLIERGPGFIAGLKGLPHSLNFSTVGAGLVAAIFGCTGPALIIINGAGDAGLSAQQISSWIGAVYLIGGLISLFMALYYKQPVTGAWSIPGAALVIAALPDFSLPEMIGAYLVASVLVLVLGLSGFVRKLVAWLPMPILMAMIGGVLFGFTIDVVVAAETAPYVVGAAVIGYFLLSRFVKVVPGVVGALVLGSIVASFTGGFESATGNAGMILPSVTFPEWNWLAALGVGIPLALVIQAENIQSMGVMIAAGFRPPVNNMTVVSGAASVLVSSFGGHNGSIAGPMTAICGSDQAGVHRDGRYAASIVNGIIFVAFGAFAGIAVTVVTVLPQPLIAAVAGLAMLSVLLTAFGGAFGAGRYRLGALVTLVVAMSDMTLLGVSSPFWSLVAGVITSLILESNDFRTQRLGSTDSGDRTNLGSKHDSPAAAAR